MERILFKNALIAVCRNRLLDAIQNLEAAMHDAQLQANEYGAPRDRYDAFRNQLMRRKDMHAQQLDKVLQELQALDRIDANKRPNQVDIGTIVLSDEYTYFISIGLGKVECEGRAVFAISPMVPISQALIGKKAGESVKFRDQNIRILDIL
jgi:transcription elongation GreA/GreB family factor